MSIFPREYGTRWRGESLGVGGLRGGHLSNNYLYKSEEYL